MLDKKLAEIDVPDRSAKTLGFSFGEVEPTGNEVLNVKGLSKSFGSKHLFSGVEFQIRRSDRAFLLGPNGCGKTTLLKILIGKEKADSGSYLFGAGVQVGYFDQTLSSLNNNNTVLDEIWNLHRDFTEAHVRTLLGQFLFCADDVFKKIETLSGGEKARLSLLKLMLSGANVLLLDEPTTFLDVRCQFDIIELVCDLNRRLGITVLMVLHDLNLAARCSDILVTLKERKIRHIGTPAEILRPEILRDIFGIEAEISTGTDGIPYCIPTGSVKEDQR